MTIRRAEHEYIAPPEVPVAERCPLLFWKGGVLPKGVLLGTTLYATVNVGQWVVSCPKCNSAQTTSPADPRFFCVECGSGWYAVKFPDNVGQLEDVLNQRIKLRHRNWLPGETIADLQGENYAHPELVGVSSNDLPAPGMHLVSAYTEG